MDALTVSLGRELAPQLEEVHRAGITRAAVHDELEQPAAPAEERARAAGALVPEQVREEGRGTRGVVVHAQVGELELEPELVRVFDGLCADQDLDVLRAIEGMRAKVISGHVHSEVDDRAEPRIED